MSDPKRTEEAYEAGYVDGSVDQASADADSYETGYEDGSDDQAMTDAGEASMANAAGYEECRDDQWSVDQG